MRRWRLALAVVLPVAFAVSGTTISGVWLYRRPGLLPVATDTVIPRGNSATVADALARAGVIDNVWAFRLAADLTSGDGLVRAGEFAFAAHASLADILETLRLARPIQHRLTIPEGLNVAQIVVLFDRAEALEGITPALAEGDLMPETYLYSRPTTRLALVERARSAMQHSLDQAWASRAPGLPLANKRDLLVLASIVERETSRPEERAHIAGVFLNRLRRGMRLQSDPTVAFAASGGQSSNDRGLTRDDLRRDSPYNTYTAAALPPGPIATPGLASLQAVAQPMVTDDLYFVSDGTTGHAFARTLEDHNRNVAIYRATLAHGPSN